MSNPLLQDRHPQADLFLFDVAAAPIKDLVDTLEHPFYSLSKRPEMAPRLYRHGAVQVEMIPSRKGLPTTYDKDLLIYAVSKVAAGVAPGRIRMALCRVRGSAKEDRAARDYIRRAGLSALDGAIRELPSIRQAHAIGRTAAETGHKAVDGEARAMAAAVAKILAGKGK